MDRRAFVLLFFFCGDAFAYVRTRAESGFPLFWSNPAVVLQGNPQNSSGLNTNQVLAQFQAAAQSWSQAGSAASFSYNQSASVPAQSGFDGRNSVLFASSGSRDLGWGVVAVTEVLYYPDSGQIAEADLTFNDNQFLFTSNAGDTGRNIGGRTAIYLQDVATHEIGHALGLDHSTVNLSTLVYTAFTGQFALAQDDLTAARTLYPAAREGGALQGQIRGTNGGIFGAHVLAVNLLSGKVEAATLAEQDGSFRVGDLPTGKYALFMEPLTAASSTISPYFANLDHRFCGGYEFQRRFYADCGSTGKAAILDVNGQSLAVNSLAPSCNQMGNPGGAPSTMAKAKEIPAGGGAMFGTLSAGEVHYYKIRGTVGQLQARAIAYALFSPIDLKVELLSSGGQPLAGAQMVDNLQDPRPGGGIHYDSYAKASVNQGDYLVRVTAKAAIPSTAFPAGYDLVAGAGHYLLALAVNGDVASQGPTDMASCVSVQNTRQSASFRASSSRQETEEGGGCGSLSSGGQGPFSGGLLLVLFSALGFHFFARFRPASALRLVRSRREG